STYGTVSGDSTFTMRPPFTDRTTRVSNPVRYPCFRSSASVTAQRPAFAIGVPPDICAFHRYTRNSSLPYSTQVMPVSPARPKLIPGISQTSRQTTYELFTPSNSGQRLHPTYRRPSSTARQRCITLAPIVNYSRRLPPVGVWAASQSQCVRTPSQAGYASPPW